MPPEWTPQAAPSGAVLMALAVALPLAALLLAVPLGRRGGALQLPMLLGGVAIAGALAAAVLSDGVLSTAVGGWAPPLGIRLRADGLSAAMLATTAVVMLAVGLHARSEFRPRGPDGSEDRRGLLFWPFLAGIWASLNGIYLSADLFNLYVWLEVLTLSAVPLVMLDGRSETFAAGLRYLLFAIMASLLYLLGVALLYASYGTLDIALLAGLVEDGPPVRIALALMTMGLLAKTALFPLHLWLPAAHSEAPAAASAALSGLVVKGGFYVVVRLWFDLLPAAPGGPAGTLLGVLGALAILVGSVLALGQARLKLVIAYSTVAQIGYLFVMVPLAGGGDGQPMNDAAWAGGILHAMSHAMAKASMFLAAGLVLHGLGHDRIEGLGGIGRAMPMATMALALGGLTLMGLPPSGGFIAKWLLLMAAMADDAWWWAAVLLGGGLLAAGYVFRVLNRAIAGSDEPVPLEAPVPCGAQAVALALALASVALGLAPFLPLRLLRIGRAPGLAEGLE